MKSLLSALIERQDIDIESPFHCNVSGKVETFKCLIRGFGAPNGMLIDTDWSKFHELSESLTALGYGFSSFDIENDFSSVQEFINGVLIGDWGIVT
jgi:hypothetical protein